MFGTSIFKTAITLSSSHPHLPPPPLFFPLLLKPVQILVDIWRGNTIKLPVACTKLSLTQSGCFGCVTGKGWQASVPLQELAVRQGHCREGEVLLSAMVQCPAWTVPSALPGASSWAKQAGSLGSLGLAWSLRLIHSWKPDFNHSVPLLLPFRDSALYSGVNTGFFLRTLFRQIFI